MPCSDVADSNGAQGATGQTAGGGAGTGAVASEVGTDLRGTRKASEFMPDMSSWTVNEVIGHNATAQAVKTLPRNQKLAAVALRQPVVDVAELAIYRAASIQWQQDRCELEQHWNVADEEGPNLFRAICNIKLPPLKRAVTLPANSADGVMGTCYGISWSRECKPDYVANTAQVRVLIQLVADQLKTIDPQFCFTSIQVNMHLRAKLHVDQSNVGHSYAIALGPFVGGWLWNDDGGHLSVPTNAELGKN